MLFQQRNLANLHPVEVLLLLFNHVHSLTNHLKELVAKATEQAVKRCVGVVEDGSRNMMT